MDDDPERAWVAGLRRGDAWAFDAVYETYRARLYGYLARMTGRRDLAEDLLQEVFLRLARRGRELAADTRLAAWLYTVAHHLVVSHARSAKVGLALASELARAPEPRAAGPFEALAAGRAQLAIERAMTAMTPADREAIWLVAIERMSPQEAAAVLSVKPDAMRQRLARARAKIEAALDEPTPLMRSVR
ncbi:MAG TPA: sigma-70 family RNA polymerase sigma factor [Kofleriaceae bacterium]|nr:sigma-70 family RNA polymerase sigma factor [Kofleriaceae bacterium]